MNILERIAYSLVFAVGIVYVLSAIFSFFGIGFETYGIYVMFLVAMAILYGFLPQDVGNIFKPPTN